MEKYTPRNKAKTNTTLANGLLNCEDTILTLEDVGEILNKSREAVLKMCQRKLIPAHKCGKSWVILKSELIQKIRTE